MKPETEGFKVLIVDDEEDYRVTYQMLLEGRGYLVSTSASAREAMAMLEQEYFPLVITDLLMPGVDGLEFLGQMKDIYKSRTEVIMVTGYGSIETVVKAMKAGAFGYFIKSHNPEELLLEIEKVQKMMELWGDREERTRQENSGLLQSSKNRKMQELWQLVEQVAPSKANILLLGESGVGKEIVAQQLHRKSGRGNRPFIPVNCQHYPENLIESELFGHEKGAFTGALSRRAGKLEESSGGTLFLDEIGDMAPAIQVKLLRVLETKQIERVGSNKLISVDFRLVSATNKDIWAQTIDGTFREDFLYRINTIEIRIPPLRERPEDIPAFIDLFIRRFSRETGRVIRGVEPSTEKFLMSYSYPGNVRELKNMLERMVILAGKDGVISLDSGKYDYTTEAPKKTQSDSTLQSYKAAKQEFERGYIGQVLENCAGNITKAAEAAGLSRRQMFNKIVELGISASEISEGK